MEMQLLCALACGWLVVWLVGVVGFRTRERCVFGAKIDYISWMFSIC